MHLYAVASVANGPSSTAVQSTAVDTHSGATPFWWSPMEFDIDETKLEEETLVLCVKCRRSAMMGPDKRVGSVELPVKALLEYHSRNSRPNLPANIAVSILSKSEKLRGVLYMSFMFDGAAPAVPKPAPSAPPLEEYEDYGRQYCAPVVVVPSAPYLPSGEIVLH